MPGSGRLVGVLLNLAGRYNPAPPRPPSRPTHCPRCQSGDIHGIRPCVRRADLDDDPTKRNHDWHCHQCRWSDFIGDSDDW